MNEALPTARVAKRRPSTAWLLPLFALVFVGYLLRAEWGARGTRITLRAVDGHGIGVGDPLVHRGIRVGEVRRVVLTPRLHEAELELRLAPGAEALARAGSRFWIVHPQVSLQGIRGLETLVGARYVAVLPGPVDAETRRVFVAESKPPLDAEVVEAGLEITLEARERHGLLAGAPITYRGVRVGTVLSVGLASDATSVEARAYIRPAFVSLVRERTRFFLRGGFEFEAGLARGMRLSVDSLEALVSGGVAIATPEVPGAPARDGARFGLALQAEEEWSSWAPPLPLGELVQSGGEMRPRPVRILLSWQEGRLFKSDEERMGWGLVVHGGLLAPEDLLVSPEDAREGSVELTVDGRGVSWDGGALVTTPDLARLPVAASELDRLAAPWPAARSRPLTEPEDVLVFADPSLEPIAVSAARMRADGNGRFWLEEELPDREGLHGAAVVARSDGALVAVSCLDEGEDDERLIFIPFGE